MYQIDNSSAAAVIPASTPAGTPGFFTDGNPATGIAPTVMPAEFMNMVMMEILGVLSAAGVTPSKTNFTQLVTAIRAVNKQSSVLADTGTAGAYAAANVPALTVLPATGFVQRVNIVNPNPGAATYSPDGLAVKPIYGLGLQPLQGGELPAGVAVLMYLVQAGVNSGNGAWIVIESLGGASQVAPGIKSQQAVNLGQLQAQTFGFVNKFANGAFRTNQRGYVSGTALAAGVPSTGVGYGHDGFRAGPGGMTYTFTQSLGPTQITITAGTGIMTAEDVSIEGGTYLLSWTGAAQARVGINNAAPSGTYASSPILISAANAGQAITAEFNAGTLGTVQLKSGTAQVSFEWPDPQSQLARCQRYLPVIGPSAAGVNGVIASGQCTSTTTAVFPIPFKVTPRVPPTGLTAVNPAGFQASNASYTGATTSSVALYGTTSNYNVGVLLTTAGAALVAGNASTLLSVTVGAQLIFTGAEI